MAVVRVERQPHPRKFPRGEVLIVPDGSEVEAVEAASAPLVVGQKHDVGATHITPGVPLVRRQKCPSVWFQPRKVPRRR